MANPIVISIPANQWTIVATGVTIGQIEYFSPESKNVLVTHRDTGDPEPTDLNDASLLPRGATPISDSMPIDVWVYCTNGTASLKVSL